ncbi:MAG: SpoIVB peptidase S55 domain-containing protein [Vicinamibacteria bacterium]
MSFPLSKRAPKGSRLVGLVLLLFSAAVSSGSAAPLAVETLPVDAIEPGMVGEGHTVFDGERVETFKATILGVLRNYGPNQDLILAKLEGGPLSETGVIAGMSGSPVYIGGKLVGAVSYSFPFSKEAIAGITPIGEMIDATATPARRQRAARLEFPVTPERLRDIAPAGLRSVAIQGTSMTGVNGLQPYLGKLLSPIATPASINGFLPETFDIAAPLLRALGMEPLLGGAMAPHRTLQSGAGSATPPSIESAATADSLKPGDAVGVGLITGDMDVSATGTVTYVDPLTGAVYAFGHPLFNLGPIEYPMTRANVHLILPSLYSSFKLSSSGPTVGTWLQDRYTAIKGTLGDRPRMIPLTVQVERSLSQERSYHLVLVHDVLFSRIIA